MTGNADKRSDQGRAREPVAGVISDVKPQRRHPDRVSIFIDGEFAFGLPIDEASRRGLREGREISAAEAIELVEFDEASRATEAAMQLLSYRSRAERELRSRLRRKGYSDLAVDRAIERVREWGYLNDEAFAEQWVNSRMRGKPRGARLLRQELRQKGIDREVADQVIEEAEIDEHAAALELARKRNHQLRNLDAETRDRRLKGYLGRRGFGWPVIRDVLRDLERD